MTFLERAQTKLKLSMLHPVGDLGEGPGPPPYLG